MIISICTEMKRGLSVPVMILLPCLDEKPALQNNYNTFLSIKV